MIVTSPVKMDFNMLSKVLRIILFSSLALLLACDTESVELDSIQHLVGEVSIAEFQQQPYKQWFDENHSAHTVDLEILEDLQSLLTDVSITVFMGTWCHDSQREVPALLKILDSISFDENRLRIIALSLAKDTPGKIETNFDIKRTPTIIFSRNQKEIGRFVEYPQKSLEQDIRAILKNHEYRHSYADQ
jgi:thiol-disulfide isomerase/thioredoxin